MPPAAPALPGRFHGAEVEVARTAGALAARIVHPEPQSIAEHSHDWPVLSVYRLGAYRERGEGGDRLLDGPSVVFHPAGAPHADEIGERGLETLVLAFDPDWLPGRPTRGEARSRYWNGGAVAAAAGVLARQWLGGAEEAVLRQGLDRFLGRAFAAEPPPPRPAWMGRVEAALADAHDPVATDRLARDLSLHPAWLARAYRAVRGEGLREAQIRRRVEQAVRALRSSQASLADIAQDAGFCDQSHMNRALKATLGLTPLQVRREAGLLRG